MNGFEYRRRLLQKVGEAMENAAQQMVSGNVPNMRHYKMLAGRVSALREIEEMCNEVEKDASNANGA